MVKPYQFVNISLDGDDVIALLISLSFDGWNLTVLLISLSSDDENLIVLLLFLSWDCGDMCVWDLFSYGADLTALAPLISLSSDGRDQTWQCMNVKQKARKYIQRRVKPDQGYFTVQIIGINFDCSLKCNLTVLVFIALLLHIIWWEISM